MEQSVAKCTLSLLELLPAVSCVSPREVMTMFKLGNTGLSILATYIGTVDLLLNYR